MRVIRVTDNEIEIAMIQGLLNEAGIPVAALHVPRGGYPEIASIPLPEYEIVVPDSRAGEAEQIIREYLSTVTNDKT